VVSPRRLISASLAWLLVLPPSASVLGQPPERVPRAITPAQRLALRQIDQLIEDGGAGEVIDLVIRTMDESDGRLVGLAENAAVFRGFERYVPLNLYLNDRLLRWGLSRPEVLAEYRRRTDASAAALLRQARRGEDVAELRRLVDRFLATSHGDEALQLLGERAAERGWYWTAIDAWQRIDPRWQAVAAGQAGVEVAGLGWELVLPRLSESGFADWLAELPESPPEGGGWPVGSYHGSDLDQPRVGWQLVGAYRAVGEELTARRLGQLVRHWYGTRPVWLAGEQIEPEVALRSLFAEAAVGEEDPSQPAGDWPTFAHSASRVYQTGTLGTLPRAPSWSVTLPAGDNRLRTPPRAVPIGAPSRWVGGDPADRAAPRLLPVIEEGLLIAATSQRLHAFSVVDGTPWPPSAREEPSRGRGESIPLYRADLPGAVLPRTGVLPSDGPAWHGLSVSSGRVLARMGPAEAGWSDVARPRLSASTLVAIDLRREGRLLAGYPAELPLDRRRDVVEFEAAPLIVGGRCYVGLNQRDDAVSRSSIGCFDLASGVLLWESPTIGAARRLVASSALEMAAAVISYREGRLYYQAGDGVVAALDSEDGRLLWATRYRRGELEEGGYPRRRRARQRRASPVALAGPLAVVAAADADRLLALDAERGALCWATAPGVADDVDQVLGARGERLIVGGDSLYWLRRNTGQVLAQWPAGVTRQPGSALPSPRRSGRGLVAGRRVYWPVSDALWVFDAELARGAEGGWLPRPVERLDLQPLGLRGGDLIAGRGVLVISAGWRLSGFVTR
jgi:hypothetical protein